MQLPFERLRLLPCADESGLVITGRRFLGATVELQVAAPGGVLCAHMPPVAAARVQQSAPAPYPGRSGGLPVAAGVTTSRRRTELLLYLGPVTLFYVGLPGAALRDGAAAELLPLQFHAALRARVHHGQLPDRGDRPVLSGPDGADRRIGVVVTVISLILGYPLALKIARSGPTMKSVLIAVTLSPLLINLLVRTYAWLVLLGDTGVVNNWLRAAGIISRPLPLGGNMFSVIVGLVHISLPLMALSLIGVLERIDASLVDAADSLGASRGRILRRIILPLSLPGIGAGSLLVFSFAISSFITPALLGGNRVSTISTLIYEKFTFSSNWPVGATLVVVLAGDQRRRGGAAWPLFPGGVMLDKAIDAAAGWWCCSSWGR